MSAPVTPKGDRALNTKSLAIKLDTSERNARQILERGIIPSFWLGRQLRCLESSVDEHLRELLRKSLEENAA